MFFKTFAFSMLFMGLAVDVAGAACSRQYLSRCLDSVCAINIGSNLAARCQLCGSAASGDFKDSGLPIMSVGASARYSVNAQELRDAPLDPGARYVWAQEKCFEKVEGCSVTDAQNIYDPLIEQSCKAAGTMAELGRLDEELKKTKTLAECKDEINSCMIADTACGATFAACRENAELDRLFSGCVSTAGGCAGFSADIKSALVSSRDNTIKAIAQRITDVVNSRRMTRETNLEIARLECDGGAARTECEKAVCANNTRQKCATENERIIANMLCKFQENACARIGL